ncbi:MAG: prepilin-type N-terminal cleavage/methylation domain-containing protein [Luteitalea sp.]|nr:prepilin-type N-terminal cleavage/methylation domain-containing protein [Luteitalea sp.]
MTTAYPRTTDRSLVADPGFSLLELLVATSLVAVVALPAMARLDAGLGRVRGEAGARQVAAWLAWSRAQALSSGRSAGVRFDRTASTIRMERVLDRNGNGLRTEDLDTGMDHRVGTPVRLDELVPGARFAVATALPGIDDAPSLPAGANPVRFGSSDVASFSARGTSTPGTIYVCGSDQEQYAVRVLGATGRIRVLQFDRVRGVWQAR